MDTINKKQAIGLLFLFGFSQVLICIYAAQVLTPKYSTWNDWISDLGIGPAAAIFNTSMILLGICALAAICLLQKELDKGELTAITLAAIGAVAIGIFPESNPVPHYMASMTVFIAGPIAAILTSRRVKGWMKIAFIALGITALFFISLSISDFAMNTRFITAGKGFFERLVAYPVIIWGILFGGALFKKQ